MKNLVVLLFVALCINASALEENKAEMLSVPTHTKVVRNNRGLFGYKYVTDASTPGNIFLLCAEPGFHSCRLSHATTIISGPNNEEQEIIQNTVDQRLADSPEITTGNFWYSSYFVTYSLNATSGETEINIYTEEEASSLE